MQQLMNTSEMNEISPKQWFKQICESVVDGFAIDDHNREVVKKMYEYTFRLPEFEEGGFSLNKGILMLGPYGTGKSDLMMILCRALKLLNSPIHFRLTSTWQIAMNYTEEGFESFTPFAGKHTFFDELGVPERESVRYMGNPVNVADAIILYRYNEFKNRQILSHFTTNMRLKRKKDQDLSLIDNLETYLDGRSFSRLQEMCNVIVLTGPDRRSTAKPKAIINPTVEQVLSEEEKYEGETRLIDTACDAFVSGEGIELMPIITIYEILVKRELLMVADEEYEKILKEEEVRYRTEIEMKDRISNFSEAIKINEIIKAMDAGTVHEVVWRTKKIILQNYFKSLTQTK